MFQKSCVIFSTSALRWMLPIVIIIYSKRLGMKAGDCFKAGLHIGIGFVGIGLVIG